MTMQIDRLLDTVIKQSCSDLHLTVGKRPAVRVGGEIVELQTKVLEPDDTTTLMKSITPERGQTEIQEKGSTDFAFAYGPQDDPDKGARFRVNVFKQMGNLALVIRRIPSKILDARSLGLPPITLELVRRPRGLFLVTGPTGSGKSTSLAGLIDYINTQMAHHIITVEDPVEYRHKHKRSIVNQREIHNDTTSFSEALRGALRQDPDVILVGEMRDLETIEAAMTAAETGHLVFGTLHTNGAASTINRLVDAFPTNQQEQVRTMLAGSLLAVLSQQLVKRIDKRGVVAAYEFMVMTPGARNGLRKERAPDTVDLMVNHVSVQLPLNVVLQRPGTNRQKTGRRNQLATLLGATEAKESIEFSPGVGPSTSTSVTT